MSSPDNARRSSTSALTADDDGSDQQPPTAAALPLAADIVEEAETPSPAATQPTVGGPEIVDDDTGPPSLISMVTWESPIAKKREGAPGLEQIIDDDGPAHNVHVVAGDGGKDKRLYERSTGRPECIPCDGPTPFNYAEFEGGNDKGRKGGASGGIDNAVTATATPEGEDSVCIPTSEEIESGNLHHIIRRGRGEISPGADLRDDAQSGRGVSAAPVIEAYRVEDEEQLVISGHAEVMPPWWKNRNVKILFGVVCLIVIVSVIAVGVAFTRDPETVTVSGTTAPTRSMTPTSAPTTCALEASNNVQKVELATSGERMSAIDGRNMVVVTRDEPAAFHTHVVEFFERRDSGWEKIETFTESVDGKSYNVAISGDVAMIGFPNRFGGVNVYLKNMFGDWQKGDVLDPKGDREQGYHAFVDGDLAVIVASPHGQTYVFKQDAPGKWTEVQQLQFEDPGIPTVGISGNTIAALHGGNLRLFDYNEDLRRAEMFQTLTLESWMIGKLLLSGDYMVSSTYTIEVEYGPPIYTGVNIYLQRERAGNFSLVQRIDTSDFEEGFGQSIALDGDVLAVGAKTQIYIFSLLDGLWEENLSLHGTLSNILVSERTVIGMDGENNRYDKREWVEDGLVHSYSIEDCLHPMPTEMPSTLAPTLCYWLDVNVEYSERMGTTGWVLQKLGSTENWQEVDSSRSTVPHRYYNESLCLGPGQYKLSIENMLNRRGIFSLTSNGYTIAKEEELGTYTSESQFGIPFEPLSVQPSTSVSPSARSTSMSPILAHHLSSSELPSLLPSYSTIPTLSPSTSLSPSSSLPPTEECYWVEINIVYDMRPEETSWDLQQLISGKWAALKRHKAVNFDTFYSESICIPQGRYQFNIYDAGVFHEHRGSLIFGSGWDGICCRDENGSGSYSVTSDGETIVSGASFGEIETTTFELPYIRSQCQLVETAIWYSDNLASYVTWSIWQNDPGGTDVLWKEHTAYAYMGREHFFSSLCLPNGRYQFNMYDLTNSGYGGGGGLGNYSVSIDGQVVVEGGILERSETTIFDIPVDFSTAKTVPAFASDCQPTSLTVWFDNSPISIGWTLTKAEENGNSDTIDSFLATDSSLANQRVFKVFCLEA